MSTRASNEVVEAIASLRDIFEPLIEATNGLRAQLEREGWSPTMAEQMACGFYFVAVQKMAHQ